MIRGPEPVSPEYIARSPSPNGKDSEGAIDQKPDSDVEILYEEIDIEQEVFALYRKERY